MAPIVSFETSQTSYIKTLIDMFRDTDKIGTVEMSSEFENVRNPLIDVIEEKFDNYVG